MKKQFTENRVEIEALLKELFRYIGFKAEFTVSLKEGLGLPIIGLRASMIEVWSEENVDINRIKLASKLRGIIKAADHLASSHYPLGNR